MKFKFYKNIFLSSLLLLAVGCMGYKGKPSKQQKLNDRQIVEIMLTVDKLETAVSEVALKNGTLPSVTEYAHFLIDQHRENAEKLIKLALELKIKPMKSAISEKLAANQVKLVESLGAMHGAEFDHAFLDTMVKSHKEGLELIKSTLIPEAKNPRLKSFVEQFQKMVQLHLERALAAQNNL
ncbi:MAG: hypothetical protein S4CHLAM81_09610 [Chlamydiales bacterium]|nr:hypothetical protein [Chlamydiales bacterium]MCH9635739.1 hypothetical protein [Chlamydiales bacterium]